MQTITLTGGDLAAANPARLREELEAALGAEIRLLARHTNGLLDEAVIERIDGQPFTVEEVTTAHLVAENHDPTLLSTGQAEEAALDARRGDALGRLVAQGADAIRVTGLPDLADVVADIVEALDLDVA